MKKTDYHKVIFNYSQVRTKIDLTNTVRTGMNISLIADEHYYLLYCQKLPHPEV